MDSQMSSDFTPAVEELGLLDDLANISQRRPLQVTQARHCSGQTNGSDLRGTTDAECLGDAMDTNQNSLDVNRKKGSFENGGNVNPLKLDERNGTFQRVTEIQGIFVKPPAVPSITDGSEGESLQHQTMDKQNVTNGNVSSKSRNGNSGVVYTGPSSLGERSASTEPHVYFRSKSCQESGPPDKSGAPRSIATSGRKTIRTARPNSHGSRIPNPQSPVLSDDDPDLCSIQSLSRRSAPLFSKRGFGSTLLLTTSRPKIDRHLSQPGRSSSSQKKTHPSSNNRPYQATQNLQHERPKTTPIEPSSENGHVNGHFNRKPRKTKFVNYGSVEYSVYTRSHSQDNRGYFSDVCESTSNVQDFEEGQCLGADDPSMVFLSENYITDTDVTSDTDRLDDEKLERLLKNTEDHQADKLQQGHVGRGTFRTPRSLSAKHFKTKYSSSRDVSECSDGEKEVISFGGDQRRDSVINYVHPRGPRVGHSPHSADGSESISDEDESLPLIGKVETAVYARRWYLLFLFSMFCLIWNAIWSTWGPIAQSAKNVFDWTDANIAMFTWLGNLPFLVTMFPIAYLMDVKGMRVSMVLCCGLTFIGAGLRCIPGDNDTVTWYIYAGQLLNGIAGTVPMSGPALLSGLWFPNNQRASATAISTVMGYLGACVSFVVGPLLVPEPDIDSAYNSSSQDGAIQLIQDSSNSSNSSSATDAQKQGIMNILYYEFGAAGLLFLSVVLYFPSKPKIPPSVSASVPREKYLDGLKLLVRNKQFLVTAIAFSVPIGVYEVWQVVLDVNLNPRVSQETAGWLDFYATLGGVVSGLLVSRFADMFTRQMKLFLLVFYIFATVSALWLTLLVIDVIPFDTVSLYASIVMGGVFLDGGAPLFFELVIEVSYPVGEGVTSGCLQLITSSAGLVFLSMLQIDSIGKEWMNWCYFGCTALAIPLLFFIDTTYGRADIDDMEIIVEKDDGSDVTADDMEPGDGSKLEKQPLLDSSRV